MRAVESALPGTSILGLRRAIRRVLMLAQDSLIPVAALQTAFFFRFEGGVPAEYVPMMGVGALVLAATRPLASAAFGLDRWSFRMSGLLEAARLVAATTLGSAVFVLLAPALFGRGVPRSIAALEFFLTTSLMAAYRFGPRLAHGWMLERNRCRKRGGARRTLIVGAGNAGDLLLRDLLRSGGHDHSVVGFLDDDPAKIGTSIGGKVVLGRIADLPRLIDRQHVSTVMLAIPSLAGERVREILRLCSRHKASFKIVPSSFAFLNRRLTAAMLHDLAPEHLLPRGEIAFEPAGDPRRSCRGGASSSPAGRAPSAARSPARWWGSTRGSSCSWTSTRTSSTSATGACKQAYPKVDVRVEVADIRDEARLHRLGAAVRAPVRVPRRGPQARPAHGGRARGGDQEQRARHPARREDGRRAAGPSGSCSSPPTRR